MTCSVHLPLPAFDALPLGAHRAFAHTHDALFQACGVRIAFTGRAGGVSEGACASLNCGANTADDLTAVRRNREIVCRAAGAAGVPLIVPNQVHGTRLIYVEGGKGGTSGAAAANRVEGGPAAAFAGRPDARELAALHEEAQAGADGVVVAVPGVGALLNFADCLPLVLVAPTGAFAVVHAGWRGAVAHIASKAAGALERACGVPAAEFNAYIGPHIHAECFEVGEEVSARFAAEFGSAVVTQVRHVSLSRAVAADLQQAGMASNRIADVGICTKCHSDDYFSYRASNGNCGRHSAFAFRRA